MIWFTSDWHLGHKNVIKYCNRPFKDVQEMDRTLINNYRSLVKEDDVCYFLGDFSFSKDPQSQMRQLPGHKIFLWGNHDKRTPFNDFPTEVMLDSYGMFIHMTHFPIASELASEKMGHEFDLRLVGHVHEKWLYKDGMINVGVDKWDFKPVGIVHLKKNLARIKGKD